MMIAPQFLIMGGFAVLVGGVAVAVRVRERRRRAAYEQFSLVRGFTFEPERPNGEQRFRDVFEAFNQGRRRTWGYTISGAKDQQTFVAFEYRWVTGSGKHSSTHRVSGIVWERDGTAFPKFVLGPEGWLSRIGALFGMQDIDFVDSPDFSRAYRLTGPDEMSIRELFTPDLRRFFEATPNQYVAGGGPFLFWFRNAQLPPAEQLDEWLEHGDQVRRRFLTA
ncbi:MAG: hypothetical protein ABR537_02585 [Gemmatimonadales bacterium]